MPFTATWMDLEIIILSERGRRKTTHDIAYMRNLKKMIQINLFIKQKQTHKFLKQTYSHQRENVGGKG